MTTGRRVRTRDERMHDERRAALLSGDVATVRAWASKWCVPSIDCDDALLLESITAACLEETQQHQQPAKRDEGPAE